MSEIRRPKPRDRVRIVTPENPRLDGLAGTVVREEVGPAEFGAVPYHVVETGHLGPGSTVRLLPTEFVRPGSTNGSANGQAGSRGAGYSGDVCENCQGSRMKRNGACLVCDDCGQTTGCG